MPAVKTKTEPRAKPKIALVGSSGGGAATLGTSEELMKTIEQQLVGAGMELVALQMVICPVALDIADVEIPATLWTYDENRRAIVPTSTAKLAAINELASNVDGYIAARILCPPTSNERIDGLIIISADVDNVNKGVIDAAAAMGIPVVGTGGTSIKAASAKGVTRIGFSGGTVATASMPKAINIVGTLASHFGLKYTPQHSLKTSIITNTLVGCLPAVLAMHIFCQVVQMAIQELVTIRWPSAMLPIANFTANRLAPSVAALASDAPFLLPVVMSAIASHKVARYISTISLNA
jgi:hypothetical protein